MKTREYQFNKGDQVQKEGADALQRIKGKVYEME